MNTLRAAFVPGLIAGIVSIFTSWFWMGLVFHRYQRATPETWRPEGPRNYALSSLVRVFSAIAISALYVLVARFHVGFFADGMVGALRFAALIWIALSAPVAIEAANLCPHALHGGPGAGDRLANHHNSGLRHYFSLDCGLKFP